MTEFGYYIVVSCNQDLLKAREELMKSVQEFQKLGYEVSGNFSIHIRRFGWFFKLYYFHQPMVKKAKIKGVNC